MKVYVSPELQLLNVDLFDVLTASTPTLGEDERGTNELPILRP